MLGRALLILTAVAALVVASARSSAAEPPTRVVSLNLCIDQLALALAAPGQLVGVSDVAQDPHLSAAWRPARTLPAVRMRAEEALALRPDLVLLNADAPAHVVALLRWAGVRVAMFPEAVTFDSTVDLVQRVADVLGRSDAGVALADDMRARQAALTGRLDDARPLAAVWQANGFTVGVGSLPDDLLRRAGWRNLAAERGGGAFASLPLETLLRATPDLLILDGTTSSAPSLAEGLMTHRAVRRAFSDSRTMVMPHPLWLCGGPQNLEALERLVTARSRIKAAP